MTDSTTTSTATAAPAPGASTALRTTTGGGGTTLNADTTHGRTVVSDAVVAKIAGIAARDVPGVHDLGGGVNRAIGAIRQRLNASDHAQGITVEVGETQVAADVTVVADYPTPLQQVADGVRQAIIGAIEGLVGLEVTEVNVTIADVYMPSDDEDEGGAQSTPRVQ